MSPEAWTSILALAIPVIVSLLKKPPWSLGVKTLLVGAVSLVVATTGSLITGNVSLSGWEDPATLFTSVSIAFAEATLIYNLYFRNIPLNETLEDINILG